MNSIVKYVIFLKMIKFKMFLNKNRIILKYYFYIKIANNVIKNTKTETLMLIPDKTSSAHSTEL